MARCDSYFQHGLRFRCYSTKKVEECTCGGDVTKCDFFPEKRKQDKWNVAKLVDRERLVKILRVPIYPHLDADPAEVVADYLLDNGVMLCRSGRWGIYRENEISKTIYCTNCQKDFYIRKKGELQLDMMPFCPNCGANMMDGGSDNG